MEFFVTSEWLSCAPFALQIDLVMYRILLVLYVKREGFSFMEFTSFKRKISASLDLQSVCPFKKTHNVITQVHPDHIQSRMPGM